MNERLRKEKKGGGGGAVLRSEGGKSKKWEESRDKRSEKVIEGKIETERRRREK